MKKILLAEDDTFIIDIYSTKLKEAGYDVEVAQDGEEVLRKLKEKKPDLLLLDIILPLLNGWEILKQIRESKDFDNLKDLAIIILSNTSQKEDIQKGKNFKVLKYIIKSDNTPSQVVEKIKEVLK